MKAVLISIRPKRCELIASGKQTIEVQKSRPKIATPFKCYIYCTNSKFDVNACLRNNLHYDDSTLAVNAGNGKVIGEFVCDTVEVLFDTNGNPENYMTDILPSILQQTALSYDDFARYVGSRADKTSIFGWHISDLKIYNTPKELSKFEVADKRAIRQCKYREQTYYAFTDTGYIKNGFYCKQKDDWCFSGCKRKALKRPPQSWMYVEELQ